MQHKWWEYYAVRYFVGTVTGAVIIAFLRLDPAAPVTGYLKILSVAPESTFLGFGLYAALGFAFCYIASAPMLVLHSTRSYFAPRNLRSMNRWSAVCLLLLILAWPVALLFESPKIGSLIGGLIAFQFLLIGLTVFDGFATVTRFYEDLAKSRAQGSTSDKRDATTEYVESYRHLREHGNAVSIVLLELILALGLSRSKSTRHTMVLIFVWLLPAIVAWFLGTILEDRMVEKIRPSKTA